jgi:exonuclease SbcC
VQLVELRLKSFRRFEQLTTLFSPGINLFSGANGSGKTTILEAIGFALFDAPIGRGGDDRAAIRPGASELSVQAIFDQDGNRYELTRTLNSKGRQARLKKAKTVTATGNDEVNLVLAGLLRVADPSALPGIFHALVGITQGGLPRPFLLDADARLAHFNPLLNLDRYELAARGVIVCGARFTAELTALLA